MSFLSEVQLEDRFGPFVAFQGALGFVPNLLYAQTLLPRVIEAQAMLERAVCLQEGALSRIQKERILLSVAVDRQDAYCIAIDSKVLSSLGAPEGQIHALLSDYRNAELSAADLGLSAILPQTGVSRSLGEFGRHRGAEGIRIRRQGDIRSCRRHRLGSLSLHSICRFGSRARFRRPEARFDENRLRRVRVGPIARCPIFIPRLKEKGRMCPLHT